MAKMNVMLLGCGTVGRGVYKTLIQKRRFIEDRLGIQLSVQSILVRDPNKDRNLPGIDPLLTTQFEVEKLKETDVIIEVMGGVEPAYRYIKQALAHRCHVVTANKELIAKHGVELEARARQYGVQLLYEASVGGGIPLIGVLQNFLKTNRVTELHGILNGTTNYILTQMEQWGRPFEDVLQEAQDKGYAEADPTSDVEGYDAMYKLAIIARLAFGVDVPLRLIHREGISDVTPVELKLARKSGYTIKLLASARLEDGQHPHLEVRPMLVPLSHPLAAISDVYNALHVVGDVVQDITLVGQGAGEKPTASAVVEDVTNVYRLALDAMHPLLTSIEEGQGHKLDHRAQYVRFRISGLYDEQKIKQLHAILEEMGFQVKGWTWLQEEGDMWAGFVCSNWKEERWADGLITRSLPIDDYRIRPCLEEVPQTETEPMMTSIG